MNGNYQYINVINNSIQKITGLFPGGILQQGWTLSRGYGQPQTYNRG